MSLGMWSSPGLRVLGLCILFVDEVKAELPTDICRRLSEISAGPCPECGVRKEKRISSQLHPDKLLFETYLLRMLRTTPQSAIAKV
jgi:hypothetical protein